MLRGVYFTSGTQEGTPIDRLTGSLARAFGLDQRRLPSLRPEQGRSYFLTGLLRDVIFGEAMLVSQRPGAARRRMLMRGGRIRRRGARRSCWPVRVALERAATAANARLQQRNRRCGLYEQTAHGLPLDPVNDADLPRLVPLLDQARALPFGVDHPDRGQRLLELRAVAGRQARRRRSHRLSPRARATPCCRG